MEFQFADINSIKPYRPYFYSPEPEEWQTLDQVDWKQSIIIEVGCGKGDWISQQAQKKPDQHFIGIERTTNKSKSLLRKTKKLNISNLTALQADASAIINQKVPKETVNELYFFYPNPIPKKRQANQRFFVGSSFKAYHDCLKQDGQIYLASNIKDYVWEAKQFLEKIWEYHIIAHREISRDAGPRTAFEKKYKENGDSLFELRAVKT